jgi:Flp pilus assembly protein TadD
MRLVVFVAFIGLSGCSIFTSKPEVIDTQANVLGPIPLELQQAFGEALVLLRDKEFAEAEQALLAITLKFPNYAGPWSNLAIAQGKLEKFDEALLSVNKALLENENFCQALSFKGIVLRELGKFKLAKEQYLAALVCNPNDSLTLYNLGVLSDLYLHDNVTALSYYQQYLATQKQQDKTVASWVVDLKRRVPAEALKESVKPLESEVIDANTSEPQLAGEE